MERGIIYEFHNIANDKYYVGQTIHPKRRYRDHSVAKGDSIFHRAIRKYGFDKFEYTVVKECEAPNYYELKLLLDEAEIKQIELRDSFNNGYNLTIGGGGMAGFEMPEESKQKNRESNLQAWAEGRNKGTTGNKEFGKHISEIQKGRKHPEETIQKIREAALKRDHSSYEGHKHSEETKQKLRKPKSEQTKQNMRKPHNLTKKHWKLVDGKRVWY